MPTLAEHWKDEGRAESLAKGRVEGARQMLLHLLELKFGVLGVSERARIDGATETDLSRWATRVLTAASVGEALSE